MNHHFSQKQKSTPFRGQRCLHGILSTCIVLVLVAVGVAIPKGTAQAFDVSTAVYDDVSFNLGAITYPSGLDFNADGTKMFVVSFNIKSVSEYTLSTGFDVSTASFVDSFSVSGQESQPSDVVFNTDGTKMFVTGRDGGDINEYTLSTGFDISTASFVDSFSVSGQTSLPGGTTFNTDGTKMFVVGSAYGYAYEYTLSTGFDVSTASYVDSLYVGQQPAAITFNPDGTIMFVLRFNGNRVNEYTLSTGFDISTASFVDSFYVGTQSPSTWALAFNTNGTKMYVAGDSTDSVFQYSVTPPGANVPEFSTWALLALLLGIGWHLQQENYLSLS